VVFKHPVFRRVIRRASDLFAPVMAGLVRLYLGLLRRMGPDRASAFGGALLRFFAPLIPANRTARNKLRAAFPTKSPAEIERILKASWENLGRTVNEYPFLQELLDFDPARPDESRRTEVVGVEHFIDLLERKGPAIIFAAH